MILESEERRVAAPGGAFAAGTQLISDFNRWTDAWPSGTPDMASKPSTIVQGGSSFDIDFYPYNYWVGFVRLRFENITFPVPHSLYIQLVNEDLDERFASGEYVFQPGSYGYYQKKCYFAHDSWNGENHGIDRPGNWRFEIRNDDNSFFGWGLVTHRFSTTRHSRGVNVRVRNSGQLPALFVLRSSLAHAEVNESFPIEDRQFSLDPGQELGVNFSFVPNESGPYRWTSEIAWADEGSVVLDSRTADFMIGL